MSATPPATSAPPRRRPGPPGPRDDQAHHRPAHRRGPLAARHRDRQRGRRPIGRDLHTTVSAIQWVITGYLLSFAIVIPLSGWALARFGGRAVWMFSLTLFLAGSVASGAAWNIGSLIAFRVVQGIGGGLMVPLITTLLVQAAGRPDGAADERGQPADRRRPDLRAGGGGPDHQQHQLALDLLRERPDMPGRAGAGLAAAAVLPARAARAHRPGGLLLLPPALVALLYGLAEASTDRGFAHRRGAHPAGRRRRLLAAYCVHALRTSATPMVDLRLLRSRTFAGASTLLFLAGLSIYGAMLLLPLYFQQVRHDTALTAGLLMVPQGLGSIAPRTLAGSSPTGSVPGSSPGRDRAGRRRHDPVRPGRAAHQLLPARRGPGRPRRRARHRHDRGDGRAFGGLSRAQVPHASSATRILQFVGGSFGAAVLVAVILDRQAAAHAAAGTAGLATAYDTRSGGAPGSPPWPRCRRCCWPGGPSGRRPPAPRDRRSDAGADRADRRHSNRCFAGMSSGSARRQISSAASNSRLTGSVYSDGTGVPGQACPLPNTVHAITRVPPAPAREVRQGSTVRSRASLRARPGTRSIARHRAAVSSRESVRPRSSPLGPRCRE